MKQTITVFLTFCKLIITSHFVKISCSDTNMLFSWLSTYK
jgi:hypothetical protein